MVDSHSSPVAMIPYVNMAPYWEMGEPPGCRFIPLVPSKSVVALSNGSIVAAAVPVGGLPLLKDKVVPLGRFGIAAREECMSVMLFSDRPFEAFDSNCSVYLTRDSASSVRLLYLLWAHLIGFDNLPTVAAAGEPVNGQLLIGDRAIKRAAELCGWGRNRSELSPEADASLPLVTDLATMWRKTFGLPFVFARWVVRKDADEAVKAILLEWLERFREQESKMVAACIESAVKRLEIGTAAAERYFKVIHRCLDDDDLLGQKRFMAELERAKSEPCFRHLFGMDGV